MALVPQASAHAPHAASPQSFRSVSLFFRVPLGQIAYVRAVVEGHDGLAIVRSAGAERGEIEWVVPEPLLDDARELGEALGAETGMRPIERPGDWPFGDDG